MFFKIKVQKSSYEDAIHFLNSDAKSFYSSNHKFIDKDYETFFKSSLLTALVDLDRVIRGTFNCDIFLKLCRRILGKEFAEFQNRPELYPFQKIWLD